MRALQSHVRHHLQTPRTAARPSSLRSVPSGFPRTMAKTQKNAAVQANRRMTMPNNGDRRRTAIDLPTAYTSLGSDSTDGWSLSGSDWIHCVEGDRFVADGG